MTFHFPQVSVEKPENTEKCVVKNGLKYEIIDYNSFNQEIISEFCCIEICLLNIIVLSVNRSDKQDFGKFLEKFERLLTSRIIWSKKLMV